MFNIILNNPEIPGNTGNIIRLSAVTGCELHLIEPLGFELNNKKLRRAGLDYCDLTKTYIYKDFSVLSQKFVPFSRIYAFSSIAKIEYSNIKYQLGDFFLDKSLMDYLNL